MSVDLDSPRGLELAGVVAIDVVGVLQEVAGKDRDHVGRAIDDVGEIGHPPIEIPGHGKFAIYIMGGVHHGLWQV